MADRALRGDQAGGRGRHADRAAAGHRAVLRQPDQLLPNGDYYASITLPSLIVGTYGGGTGLATQRECLELLGCYGAGKVRKLTEIAAATVLCGELSLGWAILTEEWVTARDRLGRNRP